nr:MAG TPA: hypothetical protein [Caudoviricetes sp.]
MLSMFIVQHIAIRYHAVLELSRNITLKLRRLTWRLWIYIALI